MLFSIEIYSGVVKTNEVEYDFTNAKVTGLFIPNDPYLFAKYLDDNHIVKTISSREYDHLGDEDILDLSKLVSFAISTSDNEDIIKFINSVSDDIVYVVSV